MEQILSWEADGTSASQNNFLRFMELEVFAEFTKAY